MPAPLQLLRDVVVGGEFRVVQPLGAGGMGAVYVAEQLSTGKRRALKIMHPTVVLDAKQRQRFAQEARVGAQIASEHVVEVIAAGVDDEVGTPWIAMELLEGEDLAALVERAGPLDAKLLVVVFRQLCHALGAAHAASIVHRDIKPQNVFLARSHSATAPEIVKVLDFGIAKVLAAATSTGTALVGSPAWMAPEQTEVLTSVTPAADVWALGLLAFWLLTGRVFWLSGSSDNASMHAMMREVLFEPIPPASERAAEYGRTDALPEGFDGWFARCVAREPAERFSSVAALLAALEELVPAAPPAQADPFIGLVEAPGDAAIVSTVRFDSESELSGAGQPTERGDSEAPGPPSDEPVQEPSHQGAPAAGRATTTAGLQRTLATTDSQARSAPAGATTSDRSARGWRYLTAALVGALLVGAGIGVGTLLRSEPSAVVSSKIRLAERSATPSEHTATPPASSSGAHPVPAAPPVAGLAIADPTRFDPMTYLHRARAEARRDDPDAELVLLTAYGVTDDGLMDLSTSKSAAYTFMSPNGKRCIIVAVTQAGAHRSVTGRESCPGPPVGLPKCDIRGVLKRTKRGMTLKGAPFASVSFGQMPNLRDPGWYVRAGGLERELHDDCADQARPE